MPAARNWPPGCGTSGTARAGGDPGIAGAAMPRTLAVPVAGPAPSRADGPPVGCGAAAGGDGAAAAGGGLVGPTSVEAGGNTGQAS
jgi:hypothetical protein